MATTGAAFAASDAPESEGLAPQAFSLQITLHSEQRFRPYQFHYARTLALDSRTAPLFDASDAEGQTPGPQQASASSSVRPRSFW